MQQMLFRYGRSPSDGEQRSWRSSIPVLARDLTDAGLGNVEVLLEHQLPLTSKRVDALLAGFHPKTGEPSYVLIELKQWTDAQLFEGDEELVLVPGYGSYPVLHPVAQVRTYCQYLLDFVPSLAATPEAVSGVAYLHNATQHDAAELRDLGEDRFGTLFTGAQRAEFHAYLRSLLDSDRPGTMAADDLLNMKTGPSRQLLAVAADEIQTREQFVLIAEQRTAYRAVLHAVQRAHAADRKRIVVVTGGPGSGKSVIALSLVGELARQGHAVVHATGSRSFTETLRKVAARRSPRTRDLFKYFNSFMEEPPNTLEVLVCDEAHRIRETSANRWTRAALRNGRPQLEELIDIARVPVFLLDEHQVVRPGELGSLAELSDYADQRGLELQHISLDEQFRCGGSEAYVRWVQLLLGLIPGEPEFWQGDPAFDVRVVHSPEEMCAGLEVQREAGFGARITAGYCWQWSDPRDDGSLVDDVTIGNWSRPWNLKGDRSVGGAPPAALWATDPAGFDQVGCIYTAQGFEYDWNGVILGPDFVVRNGKWVTRRSQNKDPDFRNTKKVSDEEFGALVRNVYKVLLTRGMIGTLIYSTDEETRDYLAGLIQG